MAKTGSAADRLCVNTLRTLSIDMVQQADSGHPGLPLGAAPLAYVLWHRHLRHDPRHPDWLDRDRFVLSPGHGSALLYSLLHAFGYDLSLADLRRFRQWGSRTPGHPERGVAPGVEATTGPLGQGTANAVGMALAERALAHRLNRPQHEVVDHFTYALVSDGDLQEGISSEAAALAGHLGLGKLVFLYDSNDVTLDGPASLSWSEDVGARFAACGWQVLVVEDGDHDLDDIDRAITQAKAERSRPSLVIVRTTIGFGSPGKQGTSAAHGSPLGAAEVALTKESLGCDPRQSFHVPREAADQFALSGVRGAELSAAWEERHRSWRESWPDLAVSWAAALTGELRDGWDAGLPRFTPGEQVATRKAAGSVLGALARNVPWLLGGDADLSCSTNTALAGEAAFDGRTGAGRNVHFGIREHAMGAIAVGMCCHGGVRPYTATFFVFSDYMRPAIRLAALSELPVIFIYTHDSIAVGEDGPTHQPVEHLMALRVMPNVHVVRPADAGETAGAWRYALLRTRGPTVLVLSRQGLATLAEPGPVEQGAYVLVDPPAGAPQVILIASGSEVGVALAARELLESEGTATRVVSMPCMEAFEAQDSAYREAVLPPSVTARVSVEAGATRGWERHVGSRGRIIGLDRFGASAPGETNLEKLGFTPERVAQAARDSLADTIG